MRSTGSSEIGKPVLSTKSQRKMKVYIGPEGRCCAHVSMLVIVPPCRSNHSHIILSAVYRRDVKALYVLRVCLDHAGLWCGMAGEEVANGGEVHAGLLNERHVAGVRKDHQLAIGDAGVQVASGAWCARAVVLAGNDERGFPDCGQSILILDGV